MRQIIFNWKAANAINLTKTRKKSSNLSRRVCIDLLRLITGKLFASPLGDLRFLTFAHNAFRSNWPTVWTSHSRVILWYRVKNGGMMEHQQNRQPMTFSNFVDEVGAWLAVFVRFSWLAGAVLFCIHTYGWLRFGEWKPYRLGHIFPELYQQQAITGWVTIDYALLHTALWQLWLVIPMTAMLLLFGLMLIADFFDGKK